MIILITAYSRPKYTKRCLDALSKVRGIEKCQLFFQNDWGGGCGSLREAYEWTACPISIVLNKSNLGCNGNALAGLTRAFEADEMVGLIEDDIEVSPDWLEFIQRPEFRSPDINAISTFRNHQKPPEMDRDGYERSNDFVAWGWATWRDKFEKFKHLWNDLPSDVSWDHRLRADFFSHHPNSVIRPKLGRSFNYGKENGTYCASIDEYYENNYTNYWSEGKTKP